MIKFNGGSVTNPETGVTKDIVVKIQFPMHPKDALIGGGMVLAGIAYLTSVAFINGAKEFEKAEIKAMSDADLIKN